MFEGTASRDRNGFYNEDNNNRRVLIFLSKMIRDEEKRPQFSINYDYIYRLHKPGKVFGPLSTARVQVLFLPIISSFLIGRRKKNRPVCSKTFRS